MVVNKKLLSIILKTGGFKRKGKNLSEEEKEAKRGYQRNRYMNMKENAS